MTHRTQDGAPLSAGTSSDLRFVPGTNRILLNSQHPIVNRVIVDAIENIRVSLLFLDAFPDAARAAEFTRDGLLTSVTFGLNGQLDLSRKATTKSLCLL